MIKNISFTGNVIINKQLKKSLSNQDNYNINKFAKNLKGDIYIEEVDQYKTGEPIYKGYVIFDHRIKELVVDTKNPRKSKLTSTQMPPEYY